MSASRDAAIAELRRQQQAARQRNGLAVQLNAGETRDRAIEKARDRESQATIEGDWVISGRQRYPVVTERLRWARTREIITRASPGADEDPNYLEMIARQAASIEIVMRGELAQTPNSRTVEICDRVLLGTVPQLEPAAAETRCGDYFFVTLSAGLIDFVYQAAKAAILCWTPGKSERANYVAFQNRPGDIDASIRNDAYPATLLAMTIREFLFRGVPRAVGFSKTPPAIYDPPLMFLTNFNERFVVAHEYGHTIHEALDIVLPGDAATNEEFAADLIAFDLITQSGDYLDLVGPPLSAQGSFFVLTALDIIRRALDLARTGTQRDAPAFAGHPPVVHRLAVLQEQYRRLESCDEGESTLPGALAPARTLQQLWDHLLAQGFGETLHGKPLHKIWDGV